MVNQINFLIFVFMSETKQYRGINYRTTIGSVEYRKGLTLPTYVPQIEISCEWVDIMDTGYFLKDSYVTKSDSETKSEDQLDSVERFIKVRIDQIREYQKSQKTLSRFL